MLIESICFTWECEKKTLYYGPCNDYGEVGYISLIDQVGDFHVLG